MKTALTLMAFGALSLAACAPTPDVSNPHTDGAQPTPIACQPSDYQEYVGRNRSTIPAAPAGRSFRILCSTCAATMDYRFDRVTFTYDDTSNLVTRVACG